MPRLERIMGWNSSDAEYAMGASHGQSDEVIAASECRSLSHGKPGMGTSLDILLEKTQA